MLLERASLLEASHAALALADPRAVDWLMTRHTLPDVLFPNLKVVFCGTTAIFVLPSTSAAARKFWDIECWMKLAAELPS